MTWLMFDDKLMCAETGASFERCLSSLRVYYFHPRWRPPTSESEVGLYCAHEDFKTESEAQARFEELKKLLLAPSVAGPERSDMKGEG